MHLAAFLPACIHNSCVLCCYLHSCLCTAAATGDDPNYWLKSTRQEKAEELLVKVKKFVDEFNKSKRNGCNEAGPEVRCCWKCLLNRPAVYIDGAMPDLTVSTQVTWMLC